MWAVQLIAQTHCVIAIFGDASTVLHLTGLGTSIISSNVGHDDGEGAGKGPSEEEGSRDGATDATQDDTTDGTLNMALDNAADEEAKPKWDNWDDDLMNRWSVSHV